jgi:hypothetical protein
MVPIKTTFLCEVCVPSLAEITETSNVCFRLKDVDEMSKPYGKAPFRCAHVARMSF